MAAQASEHANANANAKIEPDALLQTLLFPDTLHSIRQAQVAADFSLRIAAPHAGVEVPVFEGNQTTVAETDALQTRILAFLESVNPSQIEGKEGGEIVLRPDTQKEKKPTGQTCPTACRSFAASPKNLCEFWPRYRHKILRKIRLQRLLRIDE